LRDVLIGLFFVAAALWLLAVIFGFLAGPTQITTRHSLLGNVARFCRAVAPLSP
jgi:hypothetical protein